jgi:hypothetical protein
VSQEAQAERERRARRILGQAEIAEKFGQATCTYQDNPVALHLLKTTLWRCTCAP